MKPYIHQKVLYEAFEMAKGVDKEQCAFGETLSLDRFTNLENFLIYLNRKGIPPGCVMEEIDKKTDENIKLFSEFDWLASMLTPGDKIKKAISGAISGICLN